MGSKSREPVLRSGRLYIRQPREDDRQALKRLAIASRDMHGRYAEPPYLKDDFAAYLRIVRGERSAAMWAFRRSDDQLTGVFTLSEIVRGHFLSAYLGYYGNALTAGHGYMAEGLRLVLSHTFTGLGLHRLEANIEPMNQRSIALAKRVGFRKEGYSPNYLRFDGQWRDCERWAITREDWLPTSDLRG